MAGNSMGNHQENSESYRDIEKVLNDFDSILKNPESTLESLWKVLLEIAEHKDIKPFYENGEKAIRIEIDTNDNAPSNFIAIYDKRKGKLPRNLKMIHSNLTNKYLIQENGEIKIRHSNQEKTIKEELKDLKENPEKIISFMIEHKDTSKKTTNETRNNIGKALDI